MNCWRWVWTTVPMVQPSNELLVLQSNVTISWDASYTAFFIPVRLHVYASATLLEVLRP